jgi:hypothetical protein
MIESFLIDEHHKKPYYAVDPMLMFMYSRCAGNELGVGRYSRMNNWSNKTKKHFGFVLLFRKVYKPDYPMIYEPRVEIHDIHKLFTFRLKHGL